MSLLPQMIKPNYLNGSSICRHASKMTPNNEFYNEDWILHKRRRGFQRWTSSLALNLRYVDTETKMLHVRQEQRSATSLGRQNPRQATLPRTNRELWKSCEKIPILSLPRRIRGTQRWSWIVRRTRRKRPKSWGSLEPFERIGKDQTKRIENRINRYLKTLRDRGSIDSDVYNELRVSMKCTRPALFNGLPKIHKPDVPVRPIVSYVGHPLYNTSKHLSRILSPFTASFSSFVQNSAHLCEILRNVMMIGDDKVLVCFDVKSLYTSVPIEPALQAVRTLLENDCSVYSWSNGTNLKSEEIPSSPGNLFTRIKLQVPWTVL